MTEAGIKTIVKETVRETLIGLGFDAEDPTEVQRDLAFLRRWRTNSAAVGLQTVIAVIVAVAVGLAGLVWTIIAR